MIDRKPCFYSRTYFSVRAARAIFSPTEQEIISHIIDISKRFCDNGGCTMTNAAVAKQHQCKPLLVSQAISKANKLGWVRREDTHLEIGDKNSPTGLAYKTIRKIQIKPTPEWELFGELWDTAYFDQYSENAAEAEEILENLYSEMKTDKYSNGDDYQSVPQNIAIQACLNNKAGLTPGSIGIDPNDKGGIPKTIGGIFQKPPIYNININNNLISKDISIKGAGTLGNNQRNFADYAPKRNVDNIPVIKRKRSNPITKNEIKQPIKKDEVDDLIEYWNSLPSVPKHNNPSTNIYKDTSIALKRFTEGKLFVRANINKEWLKKHDIPIEWLKNKWPKQQIKKCLYNLSLMYLDGYWPTKKDWLNKVKLIDLLYNPRQENSWMLAIMKSPPKKLKQVYQEKIETNLTESEAWEFPQFINYLVEQDFDIGDEDRPIVLRILHDLNKWQNKWHDKTDERFRRMLGTVITVPMLFATWADKKSREWSEFRLSMVRSGKPIWNEFVMHIEDELDGWDVIEGSWK